MAVNTDIATISQNPALNGPDGSTDTPSTLDDAIRYSLSFIAKLRDGVGFTAGAINAGLGYTPVQQGTGTGQNTNAVKIGWSTANSNLRVQVDTTDFGATWPIGISGNAATATNATTAANASQLGGVAPNGWMRSNTTGATLGATWDSGNGYTYFTTNGTPQHAYTHWNVVQGRPTDLGAFSNSPGYVTSSGVIQRLDTVTGMGRVTGQNALYAAVSGVGNMTWGVTVSDRRLKLDIADSTADPLEKIDRIRFVGYRFIKGWDDGRWHDEGVLAQEIEDIDPNWLLAGGTWKQPNTYAMLITAMHGLQKMNRKVRALEERIAALEGRA